MGEMPIIIKIKVIFKLDLPNQVCLIVKNFFHQKYINCFIKAYDFVVVNIGFN